MSSDIEYRYEIAGERVTVFSIEVNGENFFHDLWDSSEQALQAKIDMKIKLVAENGINVGKNHFNKLKGKQYKDNYYIKILNPLSIRISATTFNCDGQVVILIFGWKKKSNDADKKTYQFYNRAQKIINEIHGDPDETKKKLREAFKRK